VSVESSPSPASSPVFQPSGCPRCGVKLDRPYKYCPNCSYRLRPDLVRHHPAGAPPIRQTERLLAIGGYLGFVSLLLLLVLTGLRLFESDPMPPEDPLRRINVTVKDVEFGPDDLQTVAEGEVSWGAYRPVDATGVLRDLKRRMPSLSAEDDDPRLIEVRDWLEYLRSTLAEHTRALLPDLYHVDDPFSIGVAEITNEQWYAFLVARATKSGRQAPPDYYPTSWSRSSPNRMVPRIYPASGPGKPVSDISCIAALEFCNWVWEEVLGADPDLIVDLPTPLEFARSGRGDPLDNFPWGRTLDDLPKNEAGVSERVNLSGQPLPARHEDVGYFRGLHAQIGNVAEWIHIPNGFAAAGWSYLGSPRSYATERGDSTSPFAGEELEEYPSLSDRAPHIGFRIVIRRVPRLPAFATVTAGPVQFVARPNPVMPPKVQMETVSGEFTPQRLPPIEMPAQSAPIKRDFAIATNEITNRQFLAYLVEEAPKLDPGYEAGDTDQQRATKDEVLRERRLAMLPGSFQDRAHPLAGREVVFGGPFGRGDAVQKLFEAGTETQPVQGVTPDQAQDYARWLSGKLGVTARLPTAAEYVRAGRQNAASPYPWGAATGKLELICEGRADDQDRARSLYSFLRENPGSIQGLCGNALELVQAPPGVVGTGVGQTQPSGSKVWLLAGGCFEFEPGACTLDSYLDPQWTVAEIYPDEEGTSEDPYLDRVPLAPLTGFRVVLEATD